MKLAAIIITVFSSSFAHAGTAIFPVTATNISATQADAIGAVLAQQYAKISAGEVIPPGQAVSAIKDGRNFQEAAKALGATEYVETTVVALDTRILIDATRRDAKGTQLSHAQMVATSLDDVVEASDRLARALIEKKTTEETMNLDNITKTDSQHRNRVRSSKILGVKASLGQPLPTSSFEPFMTIGFDGRFEGKRHFLEFGAGVMLASDRSSRKQGYGGLYSEFGGSLYLFNGSISPYIGMGVLPRLIIGGNSADVGIAPYAQLGVVFGRESTTRFYTDARVVQNVFGIKDQSWDTNQTTRTPTELIWQFGIGW